MCVCGHVRVTRSVIFVSNETKHVVQSTSELTGAWMIDSREIGARVGCVHVYPLGGLIPMASMADDMVLAVNIALKNTV